MPDLVVAGLGAFALALVHVFAGRLTFLEGLPRSRWLSAAGGISVAYVFLHLLPEVADGAEHVARALGSAALAESCTYLLALAGLATFYGLERHAQCDRERPRDGGDAAAHTSASAFWIHIGAFALYNALVAHLVLREDGAPSAWLLLHVAALGIHFVVNDFALREHHAHRYVHTGRWILAAAVVLGGVTGTLVPVPRSAVALLTAFLAGGIVLNVLKEELPSERQSRYGAFCVGAAVYAGLLVAAEHLRHATEPERAAVEARGAAE